MKQDDDVVISIPLDFFTTESYTDPTKLTYHELPKMIEILKINIGFLALLQRAVEMKDPQVTPHLIRTKAAIRRIKKVIGLLEKSASIHLEAVVLPESIRQQVSRMFKDIKAHTYDDVEKTVETAYKENDAFRALVVADQSLYLLAYFTVAINTLPDDYKDRKQTILYNDKTKSDIQEYFTLFKKHYTMRFDDTLYTEST